MSESTSTDTFPRQYARTQRFTLGEPRTFSVDPDGRRIVFLRSRSGGDAVNCLWELDLASGTERMVVDPVVLFAANTIGDLSPEELAQRERLREAGGGITSYTVNEDVTVFAFAVSGQLFAGEFSSGETRYVDTPGAVFDPHLDPAGTRIAFVVDGELHRVDLPGFARSDEEHGLANDHDLGEVRVVAGRSLFGENRNVSWGVAEFIAAEEMGRYRGYWWSTDGRRLAVARVDESPVDEWTISDPSQPALRARTVRYPAAGTPNALVSVSLFDIETDERRDIVWDTADLPYLADVQWHGTETVVVTAQTRDQKRLGIGRATWDAPNVVWEEFETSDTWVDLIPGSPAQLSDGSLARVADRDGVKRLIVEGRPVTPTSIDVRHIVTVVDDSVVFMAIDIQRPESWSIWKWDRSTSEVHALTPADGVHSATAGGTTIVVRRSSSTLPRPTFSISSMEDHRSPLGTIESYSEAPLVEPNVTFVRAGDRGIPCAVILPRDIPMGTRLPILMDPYGGPHAQRVVDSYAAHCTSQWFADHGFAVIVADGRGTPGLGTEWERSVSRDLASAVLDDQVEAIQALAGEIPALDTSRVAIRGWSFGGYLAALAVLRRPDVFHAGIAGAPVTDWRLYDTHYTERYLGDPVADHDAYERTSLIPLAPDLTRPLLLIHGLADDNVVAAHTLQLSAALLAAGRSHEVLPLSGVTHMTPQAVVAENLLLHQLDFLRRALLRPR